MNQNIINEIKRALRDGYGINEDPAITEIVPGDEGRYLVELSDGDPWIWDSIRKTFVD